jgi:CheY-like chemotaxis protein
LARFTIRATSGSTPSTAGVFFLPVSPASADQALGRCDRTRRNGRHCDLAQDIDLVLADFAMPEMTGRASPEKVM